MLSRIEQVVRVKLVVDSTTLVVGEVLLIGLLLSTNPRDPRLLMRIILDDLMLARTIVD